MNVKINSVWFADERRHIQEEHGGNRHKSIKPYHTRKQKSFLIQTQRSVNKAR